MKIIYRFPKVPLYEQREDLVVDGTPPNVGEKVILSDPLNTCVYVVARRVFRLQEYLDFHMCKQYEQQACINLEISPS